MDLFTILEAPRSSKINYLDSLSSGLGDHDVLRLEEINNQRVEEVLQLHLEVEVHHRVGVEVGQAPAHLRTVSLVDCCL